MAVTGSASDGLNLPEGYWTTKQSGPILEKTLEVRLAPDLSHLSPAERKTVDILLKVGEIMQDLHEHTLHHQAREARKALIALHEELGQPQETQNLLDLYRQFKGPIASTLENNRVPFLPVSKSLAGKNMYPLDATRESLNAFLKTHPEKSDSILHLRSVVRNITTENLERDLATLKRHPTLDLLHPGLMKSLARDRASGEAGYYAVPYSVAFAEEIMQAYQLLNKAAETIDSEDPDFAAYLRNRARDFLCDEYEAGDASWVAGQFKNLNLQLGSYETYDDGIFGVKSFFSMSLLVLDRERTATLRKAIKGLQALEDSLPYQHHKKVRENIPVGVYNVIADFGQARGTNTATILPNEARYARKYGRTILLRYNVISHPDIHETAQSAWNAVMAEEHHQDLTLDGNFHRTLWHEIGHYLGPAQDKKGRTLDVAMAQYSDLMEEMKSDLVSLYAAKSLRESGYHNDRGLLGVRAGGIYRTLQKVKPRPSQPYQTMQLMQMNWFLEHGLLEYQHGQLTVHYDRYHEVVSKLLEKVLALQYEGDTDQVAAFIEKYTEWKDDLHQVLAAKIQAKEKYRFRLVRYGVYGE